MILWLFFFLLVPPDPQQDDNHPDHVPVLSVHHPSLVHAGIGIQAILDLKLFKMSNMLSDILGYNIDPKAPLNNRDLAKLLMNDSTTKVRDLEVSISDIIKLDRDHNKKVNEAIVSGMCKRMDVLEQFAIKIKDDLTHTMGDHDLKLDTISSYQENLLNNLMVKVNDLLVVLQNHEKTCQAAETIKCNLCDSVFPTLPNLVTHMLLYHTNHASFPCSFCGKAFSTEQTLLNHHEECTLSVHSLQPSTIIPTMTLAQPLTQTVLNLNPGNRNAPYQRLACNVCGETFVSCENLEVHMNYVHGPNQEYSLYPVNEVRDHVLPYTGIKTYTCDQCGYTCQSPEMLDIHLSYHEAAHEVHCNICDHSFPNMVQLNIHVAEIHSQLTDSSHIGIGSTTAQLIGVHQSEGIDATLESCVSVTDLQKSHRSFISGPDLANHGPNCQNISHVEQYVPLDLSEPEVLDCDTPLDKSWSQISPVPISGLSPIPQLDGHTSLDSSQEFPSIITRQSMFNARSEKFENDQIKTAPYTLNKSKQIHSLGKNASAPDFTIDVIDENNASIHCST